MPTLPVFQIHCSKFKPDPILNSRQAFNICVSHCVFFFRVCKHSFYCLTSQRIYLFSSRTVPYILRLFYVIRPNMFCYNLLMIFAFGAFISVLALLTIFRITFKFSVPVPVCCRIFQHLVVRTHYAIVVLIIYKFIALEKAFLCHRCFVRRHYFFVVI